MTHLDDIVSPRIMFDMREAGYVRVQKHPDLDLFIGNYTEKAQYDQVWNDATINCRGLIWDIHGRIVARPYRKFFNYGDDAKHRPARPRRAGRGNRQARRLTRHRLPDPGRASDRHPRLLHQPASPPRHRAAAREVPGLRVRRRLHPLA